MKTKLLRSLQAFIAKVKQFINDLMCEEYGCNYNTPDFHPNRLYFCERCGREICGRTFDDIEPMSSEQLEEFHRDRDADQDNRYFTPKK